MPSARGPCGLQEAASRSTMGKNFYGIYDPELIIPGDKVYEDEFWSRLGEVSDLEHIGIGLATYDILESRFNSNQLGSLRNPPDARKIIKGVMSKLVPYADDDVQTSHEFLDLSPYSPYWGDDSNADLLAEDLHFFPRLSPSIVLSSQFCWSSITTEQIEKDADAVVVRFVEDIHLRSAVRSNLIHNREISYSFLRDNAEDLYPSLVFHPNAWDRVRSIKIPEHESAPLLHLHLSVLEDFAPSIWSRFSDSSERISNMSAYSVVCSPEGDLTEKLAKKRSFDFFADIFRCKCHDLGSPCNRCVSLSESAEVKASRSDCACMSQNIKCDWHTKLRWNTGRIHFAFISNTVFIGTIENHLPLS